MRNNWPTAGEARSLIQRPDVPQCVGLNLTGIRTACQLGETQLPRLQPSSSASESLRRRRTFLTSSPGCSNAQERLGASAGGEQTALSPLSGFLDAVF